ncbi:MAG: hypothetical protein A2Y62_03145 [Candidatus Fischerbacteria bacterium RBG_13_37_8]|uniref:Sulfatase N-terminal domain-containing protein n=1 Tax=Candidatus Fischerbacteria bacterium RBG_13_37_8 TaxID=1817863 RepID=A0A1F5VV51_9BACT|nr:MAG: hypothetical protein A2Y62_03145 [Candidatus Fischerbacteria bacterium RBG_13_37_8]
MIFKYIWLCFFSICTIILFTVPLLAETQPPNIILITLDTVRADHIGFYGYKTIETPNIDALAAKSVTFLNAYTPSPMTLPSHASILTGLYPQTHNVHDNDIFQLRKSIETIAEFLKKKNYNTAAFVSSTILNAHYGLNQGFDTYDDLNKYWSGGNIAVERHAETTTSSACDWIQKSQSPFLLWIHYFDPHFPYNPPDPYSEKYKDKPYDGEIAYMDYFIGELLSCLYKKYNKDKLVIIVAGDHGEGLNDHEEEKHGIFLYNSTVKVPFFIKIPQQKPLKLNENVCLVDIVPTLLDYLSIPLPQYLEGKSLLPLISNPSETNTYPDRIFFLETFMPFYTYRWSHLFAIVQNNTKYIKAPSSELYFLDKDPAEKNNLFDKQKELPQKFEKSLLQFFKKQPIEPWDIKQYYSSTEADSSIKEKLKSLGYASTAPSFNKPASIPDPKNVIYLLKKLSVAESLFQKGIFNEAMVILEEILQKDKENGPALSGMSECYMYMGRLNEALTYILKAIEIYPNNDSLLVTAASIYKNMGKHDESEKYLLKALSINPVNPRAYAHLINIYVNTNKLDKATAVIEEIKKKNLQSADIYFAESLYLLQQQKLDEARQLIEKGLKLAPNSSSAIANLAKIYYLQSKIDKAIELWEQYLTLNPDNAEIMAFLGSVYWNNKKNKAKADQLLSRAIELAPEHPDANQWYTILATIRRD